MLRRKHNKRPDPELSELWAPKHEYELRFDPTLKTAIEIASLVGLEDSALAIQQ